MKKLFFSVIFTFCTFILSAQIPSSYDLRDHGLVTDTLNQGLVAPFDWAITQIKSIESTWLKKGVYNADSALSVRDLIISNYKDVSLSSFSTARDQKVAIARLAKRIAPLSKVNVPYDKSIYLNSDEGTIRGKAFPAVGFVDEYREFPFNSDSIKKYVLEYGALAVSTDIDIISLVDFNGEGKVLLNALTINPPNVYWVNILGWDDDIIWGGPSDKGAWIVQTSHNTDKGWCYIPYAFNTRLKEAFYYPKYRAYHPKEKVHLYDEKGWNSTLDKHPSFVIDSPILRSLYENVAGKSAFGVSTYALEGTELKIKVYDGNEILTNLIIDTVVTTNHTGLYMVEFDAVKITSPVGVNIVVEYDSPLGLAAVPLGIDDNTSNPNTWLYSSMLTAWLDFATELSGYTPTIKLFTAEILDVKISTDTIYKTFGETDALIYDTLANSKKMYYGDEITIFREAGENVRAVPYLIDSFTIKRDALNMLALYDTSVYGSHLKILPKPIYGSINDTTKVYGSSDPGFSWFINDTTVVTPMRGRDIIASDIRTIIVTNDSLNIKIGRGKGENVGSYKTIDTVNFATGFANKGNFKAFFDTADLTITPKPIDLELLDTVVYGEGYSIGDTVNYKFQNFPYNDSIVLKVKTGATLDTGVYTIAQMQAKLNNKFIDTVGVDTTKLTNYTIDLSGKVKVTPRPIKIVIVDTFTYGEKVIDKNFAYTSTYKNNTSKKGLVSGDSILVNLSTFVGKDTGTYTVTNLSDFKLQANGSTKLSNYDTANFVIEAKIHILPREIEARINDTITYGDLINNKVMSQDKSFIVDTVYGDTLYVSAKKDFAGLDVGTYDYPLKGNLKDSCNLKLSNGGTDVSSNYKISSVKGKLVVLKKSAKLNVVDTIVYGEGYLATDTIKYVSTDIVTGDVIAITAKNNSNLDAGKYTITQLTNNFFNVIGQSGTKLSNYNVDLKGEVVVLKRPLKISIADTFIYGNPVANQKLNNSDSKYLNNPSKKGMVGSDSISISLQTFVHKNVGDYLLTTAEYNYTTHGSTKLSNYDTAKFDVTTRIHIKPRDLIAKIDDTITYGDVLVNKEMGQDEVFIIDTVYGDKLKVTSSDFKGLDAGVYNYPLKGNIKDSCNFALMNGATNVTSNYNLVSASGKITVLKKKADLTVNDTIVYGEGYSSTDTIKYVSTDIVTGDVIAITAKNNSNLDAGKYTITQLTNNFFNIAGQSSTKLANYAVDLKGEIVVLKRPINIKIVDTFTYGQSLVNVPFSYTSKYLTKKGLVNSDTIQVTLNTFANKNVGTYTLTNTSEFDFVSTKINNYDITGINAKVQINPKDIQLSMRDTIVYGDTYTNEVVNSNAALEYSDQLTLKANGFGGYNVGMYTNIVNALNTVTPAINNGGTNVAFNYNINPIIKDTLVVTKRSINVVVNDSAVYGDATVGDVLSSTTSNIVATDNVSILLGTQMGKDVNTYTVNTNNTSTVATVGDINNYTVNLSGDFKITQRPLIIQIADTSKVYGDAISGLNLDYNVTTGNIIGIDMQNMEFILNNNFHNPVGTYLLTATDVSFQGTKSPNYKVQYPINASIKVVPRKLTVKAKDETIVQWDDDPTLDYEIISGDLVYGDLPTGTVMREPGDTIGEYTIGSGTLDFGANYDINFVDGVFEILERGTIAQQIIWDQNLTVVFGETLELTARAVPSGLPIRYVIVDPTMANLLGETFIPREIGYVDVIAYQDGNRDYKQATPVRRTVQILCPAPEIKMDNRNMVICNKDNTGTLIGSFNIELETKRTDSISVIFNYNALNNGFVNMKIEAVDGKSKYEIPFPENVFGEFTAQLIPIGIKSCEGSFVEFKFTIAAPSNLIEAKWIDVLTCNNNVETNGGIDGSYYEWYSNGKLILGESGQYLWAKDLSATYHAVIITTDGNRIPTCPIDITLEDIPWHGYEDEEITLTPNPSTRGSLSKMTINHISDEELSSARIEIFTLSGRKIDTIKPTSSNIFIYMPKESGSYLVVLTTKWRKRDFRIVVD